MQEHQLAGDAGRRVPSWYLARGDQRYGPLADRELLLLAEQGGLRTDDLLWRPGFTCWKPVHAVCGIEASPSIATSKNAAPPDAEYLPTSEASDAQAEISEVADGSATPKPDASLKTRLYDELRRFLMIFAYLWLVFLVFLVHEWIVLADHHIGFRFYGLAAINALVLSKIMLIAEGLGFAERFENRPLMVPIAYKSVLFSLLLVAAYILEEIVIGQFHGKGVADSFPVLGGGGVVGTLGVTALLCIALVPFFAFREIARTVGEAEFRTLMLGPTKREMKGRGSMSASDHLPDISAAPANFAKGPRTDIWSGGSS
jgi:hypothetical protein